MNVAVALYYGSVHPDSLPSNVRLDVQEVHDLKNIWDATRQGTQKISGLRDGSTHQSLRTKLSAEIGRLGGIEAADAALEKARPWLEKWSEGEALGRELARSHFEVLIREAQMKTSGIEEAPTAPPTRFADPVHDVLRQSDAFWRNQRG